MFVLAPGSDNRHFAKNHLTVLTGNCLKIDNICFLLTSLSVPDFALACAKYKVDINLARILLKPFGQKYEIVMLGVMIITAIFSMFMSNTATSFMMLTIKTPLVARMDSEDPGCRAMVLSIPIAANLGGIETPIGTPPNAIAFRYFVGEHALSFGGWMLFAVAITVIMIAFSWWLLQKIYPANGGDLDVRIDGRFESGLKPYIVYITMALISCCGCSPVSTALMLMPSLLSRLLYSACVALLISRI